MIPHVVLCIFFCSINAEVIDTAADDEADFVNFIIKFDKPYKKKAQEYNYRLEIFKKNVWRLNATQFDNGANRGVTQYFDATREELAERFLSNVIPISHDSQKMPHTRHYGSSAHSQTYPHRTQLSQNDIAQIRKTIPGKWDWRTSWKRNIISPVKNQNSCGGCWAFSSVETLESMYAKETGELRHLSVQQMIDCADDGNYGCHGGGTCTALYWMNVTRVGIVTDHVYPLTDTSDYCRITNSSQGIQIQNYTCYTSKNESHMLELLYHMGPLVVTIDAQTWFDYLGGIIQHNCGTSLNHAVQIVGYDITGEVPYYIVRNSWGTKFGVDGYLYVKVGYNVCGIAEKVSTVTADVDPS